MARTQSRLSAGTVVLDSEGLPKWCAAGLHGHKYAVDPVVAATALRSVKPVVILTSDVDDMKTSTTWRNCAGSRSVSSSFSR